MFKLFSSSYVILFTMIWVLAKLTIFLIYFLIVLSLIQFFFLLYSMVTQLHTHVHILFSHIIMLHHKWLDIAPSAAQQDLIANPKAIVCIH